MAGARTLLCKSSAPVVLSYADGSWTDRLAGRRLTLGIEAGMATLTAGCDAVYPASVVFGPDAVTLTLG